MKIGILTFHCAHNYGAVLQAFALKTYIQKVGHDVHVIDYCPSYLTGFPYSKNSYLYWISRNPIRTLNRCLTEPFLHRKRKIRWDKFNSFIHKGLNLYSVDQYLTKNIFDCVIYGSDQIWNASLTEGVIDEMYWGKNSRGKAISYAASMGEYRPDQKSLDHIKCLLNNYRSLSVRETDLKNYLTTFTDKEITVVCDPVFLLSDLEWSSLLPPINEQEPYVLCYNLLLSDDCLKLAKNVSEELGIQLIEISGFVRRSSGKHKNYVDLGPLEFVSYIKSASFVVTSSFHGTAFSVIFQKKFYAVGLQNKNGRVKSLLTILGIESRIISKIGSVVYHDIDYSAVRQRMDNYVLASKKYIDQEILNY